MSRRNWKRYTFSIRTLLIVTTLFGWLAWDFHRQRTHDQAIDRLQSLLPNSNFFFESPNGLRALEAKVFGVVGSSVTFRQLKTLELKPNSPRIADVLTIAQAKLLNQLPPSHRVHISNFEFSLSDVKFRLHRDPTSQLSLQMCKLRNSRLADLHLPFVGSLELFGCSGIADINSIGKSFPNLRHLSIELCEGPIDMATCLEGCQQLESLSLTGYRNTDDTLMGFEKLNSLTELRLSHTRITDRTFSRLFQMNLRELTLRRCKSITDAGLASLHGNTQITKLRISEAPGITDGSAAVIGSACNLNELSLEGTNVSSALLPHLAKLEKLRNLHVDCDYFYIDDLLPFADSQIPEINFCTEAHQEPFFNGLVSRADLRALAGLEQRAGTHLELHGLRGLHGIHLQGWSRNIKQANLTNCHLEPSVMDELALRTELWSLDLSNTNVDCDMLLKLRPLKNLTDLFLVNCKNVDSRLSELVRQLPSLRRLCLFHTRAKVDAPQHVLVQQ